MRVLTSSHPDLLPLLFIPSPQPPVSIGSIGGGVFPILLTALPPRLKYDDVMMGPNCQRLIFLIFSMHMAIKYCIEVANPTTTTIKVG